MKIAWVSAPAHARTGYGIQTNQIVSLVTDEGFDITNIGGGSEAIWGGKFFIATEKGNKFPVLPTMGRLGGRDVLPTYIEKHKFDLIITMWDCFAVNYAQYIKVPMINYLPIDAPFTKKMYDDVKNSYRIVAFSKFGYNELLKWFPPAKISYIKHGINTNIYKPISEEDRKEVRKIIGVPEDAFLLLHVGANIGERKHIPQLMLVFKKFLERHEDVYLYIYTNKQAAYPRGYDLPAKAEELGILKHLRYPKFSTILCPLEDEGMALLYAASDLYTSASMGEGFGLPIGEAQSSGLPCVVPRNSAQVELVQGHGWLADNIPTDEWVDIPVWIPTLQEYPVVNMKSLLACLEDAYQNREKLKKYSEESRKFMLQYDWSQIIPKWCKFLNMVEEELEMLKQLR